MQIQWNYIWYSLNIHWRYIGNALELHWKCIYWKYNGCTLDIHWEFIGHVLFLLLSALLLFLSFVGWEWFVICLSLGFRGMASEAAGINRELLDYIPQLLCFSPRFPFLSQTGFSFWLFFRVRFLVPFFCFFGSLSMPLGRILGPTWSVWGPNLAPKRDPKSVFLER